MSSRICFELDQSKILSSGKGLRVMHPNVTLSLIVKMTLITWNFLLDNKILD